MFTHFIWEQSVAGNDQLPVAAAAPVDEEAAPGDHAVAGGKTVQYFDHAAVGEPRP